MEAGNNVRNPALQCDHGKSAAEVGRGLWLAEFGQALFHASAVTKESERREDAADHLEPPFQTYSPYSSDRSLRLTGAKGAGKGCPRLNQQQKWAQQ